MRITRDAVEALMLRVWDQGYVAGEADGIQRTLVNEQAKGLSRTKAVDEIEAALDLVEKPKAK